MNGIDPEKTAYISERDQMDAADREKDQEAAWRANDRLWEQPRSLEFQRGLLAAQFPDSPGSKGVVPDNAFRKYTKEELDVSGIDTTGIRFDDDAGGEGR